MDDKITTTPSKNQDSNSHSVKPVSETKDSTTQLKDNKLQQSQKLPEASDVKINDSSNNLAQEQTPLPVEKSYHPNVVTNNKNIPVVEKIDSNNNPQREMSPKNLSPSPNPSLDISQNITPQNEAEKAPQNHPQDQPQISPPPYKSPPSLSSNEDKDKSSTNYSSSFAFGDKKPPFMLVTIVLFIIVSGFIVSFLFFRNSSFQRNAQTPVKVIPPISDIPENETSEAETSYQNPFISPTGIYENPFEQSSAQYQNPFGEDENPFSFAKENNESGAESYQNPFE